MSDNEKTLAENIEYRVLQALRSVLIDVIKDTTTKPGQLHPLTDRTIENIRECLKLISARERDLHEAHDVPMAQRPHFVDEPKKSTAIPISSIKKPKKDS
jgi:hypothetical protein